MKTNRLLGIVCGLLLGNVVHAATPASIITYQGRLNDGANPANGSYAMTFALYDAASGGTLSGSITNSAVGVTNGLFTVSLDFGATVFNGADRWMEIAIRTNGAVAFTTLSPRQPLTPTPYALFAPSAGLASTATIASSVAANAVGVAGIQNDSVTSAKILDGTIQSTDLSPSLLNSTFWKLAGNAGTIPGTNFLGTTDNQPLELRVNGTRALRLEPNTNGAPNLIAGSALNQADVGIVGATISGGGAENYFGFTYSNRVSANFASVGGGIGNLNQSFGAVVGGGVINRILDGGAYSGIASGGRNLIEANTDEAFIAGGYGNSIQSYARDSVIGGGVYNTNGSSYSVLAGGQYNVIEPGTDSSSIGGGWLNYIQSGADQTVVAGGNANQVLSGARESFVGGGYANVIQTNAAFSFIGAGTGNVIGTNSTWGTIAGGLNNLIFPSASYATIGGGEFNAAGFLSTVGGGQANVITNSAAFSTIGGGVANRVGGNVQSGTIGGGNANQISQFAHGSTIAGGWTNSILFNVQMGAIGGGKGNVIQTGSDYSFIGGGLVNSNAGYISVIAGGETNVIGQLADHSVISGGGANQITGSQALPVYATIAGGQNNSIRTNSTYSAISGGISNTVQAGAQFATIPGGASNSVAGRYTLAAGHRAKALHDGAFVWADSIEADFASTISNQFAVRASGGVRLETGGAGATIDGQQLLSGIVPSASISGTYSGSVTFNNPGDVFAGNGSGLANVNAATVGGFGPNGFWRTIGNAGTTPSTNFLGTADNQPLAVKVNGVMALRIDPTDTAPNIVGGLAAFRPTVIGANVRGAVVAGGAAPAGPVNGVGGGDFHAVFDSDGAIGGGFGNKVGTDNNDPDDAPFATVAGGVFNAAGNYAATVAGGDANFAGGPRSMVGGGYGNWATGESAFLGGGNNNRASGLYATVPGGTQNVAAGDSSFAAGSQAKANHPGSFVWADSQNADFVSTATNQFSIRAAGGVRIVGAGLVSTGTGNGVIGDSSGANGVQGTSSGFGASGVYGENLMDGAYGVAGRATGFGAAAIYGDAAGSGAWAGYFNGDVYVGGTITQPSDRNVKRDFEAIDPRTVLEKLSQIPINTWAYTNRPGVRHLGPVAQDFKAAFDLGADDKSIATVDADGIAFAAIQGLNQKLEERTQTLETELKRRDAENAQLKQRLDALERIVHRQQSGDHRLNDARAE